MLFLCGLASLLDKEWIGADRRLRFQAEFSVSTIKSRIIEVCLPSDRAPIDCGDFGAIDSIVWSLIDDWGKRLKSLQRLFPTWRDWIGVDSGVLPILCIHGVNYLVLDEGIGNSPDCPLSSDFLRWPNPHLSCYKLVTLFVPLLLRFSPRGQKRETSRCPK